MKVEEQQHALRKKTLPLSDAAIEKLCALDESEIVIESQSSPVIHDCYEVVTRNTNMVLH